MVLANQEIKAQRPLATTGSAGFRRSEFLDAWSISFGFLKASEEMYSGINELMSNLHSSLEDTRKYKETMSELTTNLASLNTVYGNMLSAMNVNG